MQVDTTVSPSHSLFVKGDLLIVWFLSTRQTYNTLWKQVSYSDENEPQEAIFHCKNDMTKVENKPVEAFPANFAFKSLVVEMHIGQVAPECDGRRERLRAEITAEGVWLGVNPEVVGDVGGCDGGTTLWADYLWGICLLVKISSHAIMLTITLHHQIYHHVVLTVVKILAWQKTHSRWQVTLTAWSVATPLSTNHVVGYIRLTTDWATPAGSPCKCN